MATEFNNTIETPEEEIDLRKILYIILRQWYWFLLFGILGTAGAYVYNRMNVQKYTVSTTILIPEKSTGIDMKNLFEGAMNQPSNNIYNQIEIIKSYQTVSQTLLNLDWRTSWYHKELFKWREVYQNLPFTIEIPSSFVNPKGVFIHINTISNDMYQLLIDGEIDNKKVEISAQGYFDRPFTNEYFNFTLFKNGQTRVDPGQEYRFVFNDLNRSTLNYRSKLQVNLKDKNSDIVSCNIQGETPSKECAFLNELIKVYITGKMNQQDEAQRRSLLFIDGQLEGISATLDSASSRFSDFRSQNKIIDIGNEGQMVLEQLKEIESDRSKSQMQLDYFRNLLTYLNKETDFRLLVAPSVVGVEDPNLNSLVMKLSELYNRRQVISFSAKENNPAILLIDNQLEQTRKSLLENLNNLIDNATQNISSLTRRQSTVNQQLNKLPQKEQQLINIQRQFELTNEIYTFLLQKRAEINISLASSIPDVSVIDTARPETAAPIGLSKSIILIIGFLAGLFIPLAFLMIKHFFDNKIRSEDDVVKNTRLPILGNVMHSLTQGELAVFENPKSNIAESFRGLRTNMQFMLRDSQSKVVSVHSINPGEGKSFTSVNLASILAMNDKKVVLIGADLRKPRLHKIFNLKNEIGISTYLIGYNNIQDIIIQTHIPNLWFIPSGPVPPNPAEILNRIEMKQLLDELKKEYDYIVLDNAPIGLVADGIIVSQISDLNIFILRFGVSYKHQPEAINQYAEKEQIKNIALVVNDIKTNSFGYTYYKHYQYEYYQNTYYSAEDQGTKKRKKKSKNKV